MRVRFTVAMTGLFCILARAGVHAQIENTETVDTLAHRTSSGVVDYSNAGQMFTTPTTGITRLKSFTYWLFGSGGSVPVRARLYKFNTSLNQVSGSALFVSDPVTVLQQPGGPFPYTFDVPSITLLGGDQYIAVLQQDRTGLAGNVGVAFAWGVNNSYAGGMYLTTTGQPPFAGSSWADVGYADLSDVAFSATFVPEPTGVLSLSLLLLGWMGSRRRRAT